MKQNEEFVKVLTDDELMALTGGFIEASATKSGMVVLLYAIAPIINIIGNIFKK